MASTRSVLMVRQARSAKRGFTGAGGAMVGEVRSDFSGKDGAS
jgi:hypothetical protein